MEEQPVKIAFAEDHTIFRITVIDYIKRLGNVDFIIEAEDGNELIEKIRSAEEKPDICVIDIMMPGLNGIDTVATLKRKWNNINVLVLSGFLREEYIIKMVLAGANGFLPKNVHPKELLRAIYTIHANGIYNTELFSVKMIQAIQNKQLVAPELTEMEKRLLKLIISDLTYQEIADIMHTSAKSVEGYRNRLFAKLGVKSRVGLAMYAVTHGYVTIEPGII